MKGNTNFPQVPSYNQFEFNAVSNAVTAKSVPLEHWKKDGIVRIKAHDVTKPEPKPKPKPEEKPKPDEKPIPLPPSDKPKLPGPLASGFLLRSNTKMKF